MMLPDMLIASEGAAEARVVLGATRRSTVGAASALRSDLAGSSAIEGTAVARRRGRARPFMTQSGPRAEHRVASRRSPPAVKTAAGHNLELTALRRQAAGPAGAAPVTIGKARASDGVRCIRHHHSRQSVASHLWKRQFFSVHCNWVILPPTYPRDVPDSHGREASAHAAGERQTAAEP